MQKENRPRGKWRLVVFGCIGLLLILADQLSKAWIRASLERGETLFDAGFFQIVRSQNTGVIFGLFKDHLATVRIIACVAIVIIIGLFIYFYKRWSFLHGRLVQLALLLIFCGTIGNQIDRFWLGYVTDFIDFKVWPVFNIADSCQTIGSIILAYCIIFQLKLPEKSEKKE
jgi:signal peptidase II